MTTTEKQKKKKPDEPKFKNPLDDFQMEDYMNSITAADVMEKADINNQNHTEDNENSMIKPKARGKNGEYSWLRFTVICDTDVADKLRMIAQKEGLRIRSLHQGILEAFIDQYEKKHGPLTTTKPSKQKVKDLLSSL